MFSQQPNKQNQKNTEKFCQKETIPLLSSHNLKFSKKSIEFPPNENQNSILHSKIYPLLKIIQKPAKILRTKYTLKSNSRINR